MTIKIVMKASVARRVAMKKRRTLAPSMERRDANESGKKWAAAKIREDFRRRAGVFEARSSPGIEFVDHNLGIAVIFGARHDAEIVVTSAAAQADWLVPSEQSGKSGLIGYYWVWNRISRCPGHEGTQARIRPRPREAHCRNR